MLAEKYIIQNRRRQEIQKQLIMKVSSLTNEGKCNRSHENGNMNLIPGLHRDIDVMATMTVMPRTVNEVADVQGLLSVTWWK